METAGHRILTDTFSLFSGKKAPTPAGEITVKREEDTVVGELEEVARECHALYGDEFEIATVRIEKGNAISYHIYILFDYPFFLDANSHEWSFDKKVVDHFYEVNKMLARIIDRKNGVSIAYQE